MVRPPNRRVRTYAAFCVAVVFVLLLTAPVWPARARYATHATDASTPDVDFATYARTAPGPSSPQEFALQLEALLGQHSLLAADMMRGRLRGDPDFAQAANAALGKNTDAMARLVGTMAGEREQRRFTSSWVPHVLALFNYARGVADRDEAVRAEARAALAAYENNVSQFFADASSGRLSRAAARTAVRAHFEQLIQQADTYASGDYAAAYRFYREAYAHTFRLGRTVSAALLGREESRALESPEWRLRSELGRLLGEHVALIVAAMRAGAADAPDFRAATEAVNGNTRDLAGAIDSLFGNQAAVSFQSLWVDHINALMAYTAGVADRDSSRRADALARLSSFEERFAAFLSTATEGRLDSRSLARAFLAHDRMLVRQIDAFAARDYQRSHEIAYSTYHDMFEVATQLSTAIGATVSARLPVGGTVAGGGGMAAVIGRR
jgi:hypothetical protein